MLSVEPGRIFKFMLENDQWSYCYVQTWHGVMGYGIWLYQFLIIAYIVTLYIKPQKKLYTALDPLFGH